MFSKWKSVKLVVSVLSLFCSLERTVLSREEFTVFAPGQDAAALAALSETLSSGKPGTVSLAKTIDEALKSSAEVLVFVMDMKNHSGFGVDAIAELKKKKMIGIGEGAAVVFQTLGLEIHEGACAHFPLDDLRPQIEIQRNDLTTDSPAGVITAYELKEKSERLGYNFAMYLPTRAPVTRFVDSLARRTSHGNYAPIVKQGNYILVGLAAPATLWTPEYKTFFSGMANRFAKAPRVAFAQAEWELTQPGS